MNVFFYATVGTWIIGILAIVFIEPNCLLKTHGIWIVLWPIYLILRAISALMASLGTNPNQDVHIVASRMICRCGCERTGGNYCPRCGRASLSAPLPGVTSLIGDGIVSPNEARRELSR